MSRKPWRWHGLLVALVAGVLVAGAPPALAAPGDLDPSFGTGGIATLQWPGDPPPSSVEVKRLAGVPAGGRLLVLASLDDATRSGYPGLARLLPDGTPDLTFGSGGYATPDLRVDGVELFEPLLVPLADGRTLLVGLLQQPDFTYRLGLVRLAADGSLDSTFGSGGTVAVALPESSFGVADAVVAADGRVYVALNLVDAGVPHFALARFDVDGQLDTRYGKGGLLVTRIGDSSHIFDLVALPDARLLAAGAAGTAGGTQDYALARYLPSGRLDRSFGRRGVVQQDVAGVDQAALFATTLSDGSTVVSSFRALGDPMDPEVDQAGTLARFASDGSLDPSFGRGGEVLYNPTPGRDGFQDVASAPGGKLLVVVFSEPAGVPTSYALARFDAATGALDSGFGAGGIVPIAAFFVRGLVVTPDGHASVAIVSLSEVGFGYVSTVNRYLGA